MSKALPKRLLYALTYSALLPFFQRVQGAGWLPFILYTLYHIMYYMIYYVILWVSRILSQGLKSECADISYQSFLWLLRHTDEPQRGRNSCIWLQFGSVLSSFGVVLISCRVNFQVLRSVLQYSACRI